MTEDPFAQAPAEASYPPFTVTSKVLVLRSLAEKAAAVVPTRDFQPILRNFLVNALPGRIQLSATDMGLTVLAETEAVTVTLPGSHPDGVTTVIPARRLLDCLKASPEGDVKIEVAGAAAKVTAGPASWELRLAEAEDYPALPDLADAEYQPTDRASLLSALRTVRHAVCRDASRPQYVMVDIKGGYATACDSSRMARARVPGFPLDIQVPAAGSPAALDELVRMFAASAADKVEVAQTEGVLAFRVGPVVFAAARPMVKFPDVDKQLLTPALTNKNVLVVRRDDLAEAVRRVRINADPETSAIGLRLTESHVTVFARDKFGNRAEAAAEAAWAGPERTMVLSHGYLLDLLAAHPGGDCMFRLGTDKPRRPAPLLLEHKESGVIGVLAPMHGSMVGY